MKRAPGYPHAGLASQAAAKRLALDAKEAEQAGAARIKPEEFCRRVEETREQAEPRLAEEAREADVARPLHVDGGFTIVVT